MPYKNREKQLAYMREYARGKSANPREKTLGKLDKRFIKPNPKPKPTFTYSKFDILHILNKTLRGKLSYQEYKILHDTIWKY